MTKYCYNCIMITKKLDQLYDWAVMLFVDVKIKKGHGQIAHASLRGEWSYPTEDEAIKDAKKTLKSLGIRHDKTKTKGKQ